MWGAVSVRESPPAPGILPPTVTSQGSTEPSINVRLHYSNSSEATMLINGEATILYVTSEKDVLYLGGVLVRYKSPENASLLTVSQLYDADECLSSEVKCKFTKILPDTNAGIFAYNITLNAPAFPIDQLEKQYFIEVKWATVPEPPSLQQNEQEPNKIRTTRIGPNDSLQLFVAKPAGTSDPSADTSVPSGSADTTTTEAPSSGSTVSSPDQTGNKPSDAREGGGGSVPNSPLPKESKPSDQIAKNEESTGLGGGTKAGIAVGAVFAVLLLLALIFLCLRRRKSKQRKAAQGYYGDTPGSSHDLREKEAGVGIASIPVSASPTSDGHHAHNGGAAMLGRGNSGVVVDGASLERGDFGGQPGPVPVVGAPSVARKPIGSRGVSDEEPVGTEGAISSQSQVLSDEERARWEEEERRLDEDIAEAERRRLAQ